MAKKKHKHKEHRNRYQVVCPECGAPALTKLGGDEGYACGACLAYFEDKDDLKDAILEAQRPRDPYPTPGEMVREL